MSLTLSVKVKPKDLAKMLKQEKADIARGINKAIGLTAAKGKDIILSRTNKGVGVNGAFARYSGSLTKGFWKGQKGSGYLAYRKYELKKNKPSLVNLNATGEMLRNVQSRNKDSRTAEVYFSNRNAAEKAAWNDRIRPWFSFNDGEENRLRKVFQRELFK
tara:strand:+ start:616 stop:1095 length:480 start_codon:yes stop_codon:yes gene_type:complete